MAAAATLLDALPDGAHVLFHRDLYHGVRQLALDHLPRWGRSGSFVDLADLDARARGAASRTRAPLWVETPTNPRLEIVDLPALAGLAHAAGALLVVDGTFATPALQQPLALGADVVLHSTTKYLGGHSDVQGGALVFARRGRRAARRARRPSPPATSAPSPRRSTPGSSCAALRSLACRMERHSANALARGRARSTGIRRSPPVLYPGPARPSSATRSPGGR